MRAFYTVIVLAGIILCLPGRASAADDRPCGAEFWHSGEGVYVRYCPDWSPNGRIPVMKNYTGGVNSPVGQMDHSGSHTNWYHCQAYGDRTTVNGYYNNWWALTMADNGRWGWVNEVYFQGGGNNEPDGNLPICD